MAGSWYLEANIAYCAEDPDDPSTYLKIVLYSKHGYCDLSVSRKN